MPNAPLRGKRSSRPWRIAGRAGKACAWALAAIFGLVMLALAGANLPVSRRAIAAGVTSILAKVVSGRITIESIGRVGLTGVTGVRANLRDANGRQLLRVSGVSANIRTVALVRSLFGHQGPEVDIDSASIDHVDGSLDADETGALRVVRAFLPPKPDAAAAPSLPGPPLHLRITGAQVKTGWIHGHPLAALPVDADVRGVRAEVRVEGPRVTIDVAGLHVASRGMPRGADADGDVAAHLEIPARASGIVAEGRFTGTVGAVRTTLDGKVDAGRLVAHLDADGSPEAVLRLVPDVRPREAAHLTAEASGTLPHLAVTATLSSGSAEVRVTASGDVAPIARGDADVTAEHVDLASFLENAPPSELNAHVHATARVLAGKLSGHFSLQTRPGRLASEPVPALFASGQLSESHGHGRLDIAEPGVPVRLGLALRRGPRGLCIDFDVDASAPDLHRVSRLGKVATGRGSIRAKGTADLGAGSLSAEVDAAVAEASVAGAALRSADAHAVVEGPLLDPRIDATLGAQGLALSGRAFAKGSARITGSRRTALVRASLQGEPGTPDVDASANVALGDALTLRSLRANVGKAADAIALEADTIRVGAGSVAAEGVTVRGAAAALFASGRVAPGAVEVRALSDGFDVGKAARALGQGGRGVRGQLALDVNLKTRGSAAKGQLTVNLTGAAFAGVSGIEAHLATTVEGRRFTGQLDAKVEGGHVSVAAEELTLGGSPVSLAAWKRAFGRVHVDTDLDLERLSKILPARLLPLEAMAGKVSVKGEFERGPADAAPETTWTLHTEGLRVGNKSAPGTLYDGTQIRNAPSWKLAGLDFDVSLAIAKQHGSTTVRARLRDTHGPLVELDGSADLPYEDALTRPEAVLSRLGAIPFELHAKVPRRNFSELPVFLGVGSAAGDVELSLDASQTVRDPRVHVEGVVRNLGARRQKITPFDIDFAGRYEDGVATAEVSADCQKNTALAAKTEVRAKVSDFIDDGARAPWDATLTAKFERFPLEVASLLGARRIKGTASGEVSASGGTRSKPAVHAELATEGLAVGRAPTVRAALSLDVDEKALRAKVRFDQKDGFAEASASAGLVWPAPLAPGLDPSTPVRADLTAKSFHIAVLEPAMLGVLRDLDGKIDANAHFVAAHGSGAPKLDGVLFLDGGAFELASAGQEFHDVGAKVSFLPDGTIKVDRLEAHGITGTIRGSGQAFLDGTHFRSAKITATVPKNDPFPITVGGQSMARASGDFTVEATAQPKARELDVEVNVSKARVELPGQSTHDLQPLDSDPHVKVGYHRAPDDFVQVPLARPKQEKSDGPPTVIQMNVKLGDIEVARGSDLSVRLEGQPSIRLGDTASVSGQIRLRSGFLYVQGKRFEIENGTVSFAGEADNPEVVVTAGWTAPEGSRVYADFVGPLKTGKVTLRSDPPHTKSEILSLILFGTTDGGGAPSSPSAASAGVGMASGVVTQGLNRALDDLTGLEITTRIDTSESANPRPELEVRIARDISVSVAHVLGVPAPGADPDLNFATIDWRLFRNWSLDTTVGDEGSSTLDLVWQYRY